MSNKTLHEEEKEEELLKLEEELDLIAQRILDYRITFPHQLSSTLSSILESQIPFLPTHQLPEPENPTPFGAGATNGLLGISESGTMHLAVTGVTEETVKVRLLKEKIATNAYRMPVVLKRMKQYIVRTDKLETLNGAIHPAFKRKRTSN